VRLPVMLAPIGGLESIVEGGAATAARVRGAISAAADAFLGLQPGLERLPRPPRRPAIFQLYVRGDDAWVDDWCGVRATTASPRVLPAVDVAMYSRRERDLLAASSSHGARAPSRRRLPVGLNWNHVKRFKDKHQIFRSSSRASPPQRMRARPSSTASRWSMCPTTAAQLDHGLGSAAVLPEVLKAVAGRAEVWVDGAHARTDVVKALALGAKAVGIGRLAGSAWQRAASQGWFGRRAPRGGDGASAWAARRDVLRGSSGRATWRRRRRPRAGHFQRVSAALRRVSSRPCSSRSSPSSRCSSRGTCSLRPIAS